MTEPLKFSAKLKEIPFIVEGIDGVERTYTLKQMPGRLVNAYRDQMTARIRLKEDGTPTGVKSHRGIQTELLQYCVYDDTKELVKPEVMENWPADVLDHLYREASKISGLDSTAKEESKNESTAVSLTGTASQ